MATVILRERFKIWLKAQPKSVKLRIADILKYIQENSQNLNRPTVDTLNDSVYPNLKEIRVKISGAPVRIMFIFDPVRNMVVLCGASKSNNKRFYNKMIKVAEAEYRDHLDKLK